MPVIVGAFMGGETSSIPAGYSKIKMNWVTTDGSNLSGIQINLVGPETYTVSTDSNGYAEKMVVAGDYIASIAVPDGYSGGEDKTISAKSKEEYSVVWFGKTFVAEVVISSDYVIPSDRSDYKILNKSGSVVNSGIGINETTTVNLAGGTYTLRLTVCGVSKDVSFKVGKEQEIVDISDNFCHVMANLGALKSLTMMKYNGIDLGYGCEADLLKTTLSKTFSFVAPSYSGISTETIATIGSVSRSLSGDVTINPSVSKKKVLITKDGTLTPPIAGKYRIFAIGGGGGSSRSSSDRYGTGGGGSGEMVFGLYSLSKIGYSITIGSAGTPSSNGGITSFGSLLSVAGGSYAKSDSIGGSGGAGGGGGSFSHSSSSSSDRGYNGGSGSFGGGGGGGSNNVSVVATSGAGGDGGTYGGGGGGRKVAGNGGTYGGKGAIGGTSNSGTAGTNTNSLNADEVWFRGSGVGGKSRTYSGGGGGGYGGDGGSETASTASTGGGGSSGGGGYGAKGGSGSPGTVGGGGGGGGFGGAGGAGAGLCGGGGGGYGTSPASTTGTGGGYSGQGYGAGAGGSGYSGSGKNGNPGCVVIMWWQ